MREVPPLTFAMFRLPFFHILELHHGNR